MISGQWDGKCGVNATKNNWDFFSLIDSTRSANKQIVFMGGQNSEFPERNLVPMDWAMQAAKLFFETGEFKKSLNWIHDRSGVSLAESEGNK